MNCPHCTSAATKEQRKKTTLGYRTFRCSACRRAFNERIGTPFNFLEYPTDIVLLVVLWRLRYKLSLRDLAEMFLERGFEFTYEAVRDWEACFAPLIADQLRAKRRGQAGRSWYVDETYVNVKGKWCYLYRAIDRDGNLVDSLLSEKRDMEAARRFFKQAIEVAGQAPARVTTDGHDSYPCAIRETLGSDVLHRTNRYLNNRLKQDHRGIKQRYYPMRGFGSVASAARFCRAFDEVRQFFRVRTAMRRLPRQARGEQRIAAILQAAAQVFNEVGFDAATTDMIAQRAQTAIGSLYDFFPNKEAIAQRLCEQFCDDLRVLFEGILTDELVQVPLSQLIDDILDPLIQYYQTHPGFQALWLKSGGDPRLLALHQNLTEVLTRKTAWVFARRYPKLDEASALRFSQICIRTVQALLPLAGYGPAIDSQIIVELKTMIRAYLQAVFGSESEK